MHCFSGTSASKHWKRCTIALEYSLD